jgi:formylglycine-generating enzyme required for sulfatase activity/tRNA A-37 threonylcarbamoyl transferase component Bud32
VQKSWSAAGSTDLDTGARIGRYVVLEHVGSGAMGVVYSAYDPELDRRIAVKLLKVQTASAGNRAPARLLREAKAMARLAHPNVIAVHDVGLFDDQVFLAMEFLSGGTLKAWLAAKGRSWREVLDVFIAAGHGLAAAHAAGLVHRDFKPDNVLLDKEGRPRVVDFGLARDAVGSADEAGELAPADAKAALATLSGTTTEGGGHLQTLTRTGALTGTPAYMAPEQFLGERADERTDQFSFCVALYEALYGERPFAGDDLISLSFSVTEGQIRPLPKDRGIPMWIRRVIVRGLRPNAAERFPSMAALIGALEDDPAVRRRRRLIAGGAVGAVVITLLVARQMVLRKRQEVDKEIARHVDAATQRAASARAKATEARGLRQRAWAAFDAMDREQGEVLWRQTRGLLPTIEADFESAEKSFETALVLDTSRDSVRAQMTDVLFDHLLLAEDFRLDAKVAGLSARLVATDPDGSKRQVLSAPAGLLLRTTPPVGQARIERYERDPATRRRQAIEAGSIAVDGKEHSLPSGSYRLTVSGPDGAQIVFPFEIGRGAHLAIDLTLPRAAQVPDGFVYIAPGEFWFGDADEQLRTQFLGTVPLHRRRTDAYLIAKNETTYGEWIAFLNTLTPVERARYAPNVTTAVRGSLRLRDQAGDWQLAFQPTTQRYVARVGEPINYLGRKHRARQDWIRFPVAGIAPTDVTRYVGWLRSSGKVPGARLCTELEWERAARGADDRVYPHGDELRPDDANFDATYDRKDPAFGPDTVGSHVDSRSPFGIDDLAGNVFELAISSQRQDQIVIRGGAYYFSSYTCRSTNLEPVPSSFRDVTTGFRVCASVEGGQ